MSQMCCLCFCYNIPAEVPLLRLWTIHNKLVSWAPADADLPLHCHYYCVTCAKMSMGHVPGVHKQHGGEVRAARFSMWVGG